MVKEKYNVTGMTCSACSARVEKAVGKLENIGSVSVNLLTNTMQVEYPEDKLNSETIISAVEKAGYGASLINNRKENKKQNLSSEDKPVDNSAKEIEAMKKRLTWSVIFLLPTMYIAMHQMLSMWFGLPVPAVVAEIFDGKENAISFAFSQFLLILPILYLNKKYFISIC